ncbi:MAG: caspase family protein [Hyphomonas sp.]|uniref:caspase family protein n=1 Tax=Hyphomonas sp. TaxID=87 RepID=UPI003298D24D
MNRTRNLRKLNLPAKCIAWCLAAAAAFAPMVATADDHAVIVGVNAYPFLEGGNLKGARPDALAFQDFVKKTMGFRSDQITLLLDTQATSAAVMEAIETKLLHETSPGDRVVFYFAGHGYRVPDRSNDEPDNRDEVLILSDAGKARGKGIIVDDYLREVFESIPDRRVLVVVDSCFSGTITRNVSDGGSTELSRTLTADQFPFEPEAAPLPERSRNLPGDNTIFQGQSHMSVWSAASHEQVALEVPQGGVFTRAFLSGIGQGLADKNGNNIVSNVELIRYVRDISAKSCATSKLCQTENKGRLTPEFTGQLDASAAYLVEADEPIAPAPQPVKPEPVKPAPQAQKPKQEQQQTADAQTLAEPPASPAPVVTLPQLNQPGVLTDLFVPNNSANLALTVSAGTRLHLEDEIKFDLSAQSGGTLILLDLNPKGELFQIFPSLLTSDYAPKITPGQNYTVPQPLSKNNLPLRLVVTKPTGKGHLIAVLIEDDVAAISDLLPENLNLEPQPNAVSYLVALATRLNGLTGSGGERRQIRWSSVITPYTISP